jgi:hypothetical protein
MHRALAAEEVKHDPGKGTEGPKSASSTRGAPIWVGLKASAGFYSS